MATINDYRISPREVADKSVKGNLQKAIKLALDVETDAVRHNTQTFNQNRYKAIRKIDDYEELKQRARKIKEQSIGDLPKLIEILTQTITSRGGKVFFARSKEEATNYITKVCISHCAKLVVKAKSITSEEIGLNQKLMESGIEVAETDLAEFILQVSREQPSHIVAPAIHRSRESISELFKRSFKSEQPLETGEDLTRFARDILRKKFLSADVGVTGANLIAAEEGAILLVESEGNIRFTTQLPAVHIAIAGVEKIIPSKREFGTFIELLAASGTGQSLTSYTNILEPPIELPVLNLNGRNDSAREFHLVLIDNGRMKMREDDEMKEALYCIRCSACMNVCANFQVVGGHAFGGESYTGGIGASWTLATTGDLKKASFAELCTGCSRCVPNCPVKIDIPRLNAVIKNRLAKAGEGHPVQRYFFGYFPMLARLASVSPKTANLLTNISPTRSLMEKVVGIDKRRVIPPFAMETLMKQYRKYRRKNPLLKGDADTPGVVLFADVFTNFENPEVGMATIKVFDRLGIPITLSKVFDDGRGLLSQALIDKSRKKADALAPYLSMLIDEGKSIIVCEPSVLSMFRRDYKDLLSDADLFDKISKRCFDPFEFLNQFLEDGHQVVIDRMQNRKASANQIFYHPHCQMKTVGAGEAAKEFFSRLGFVVKTSSVECCGMAGSFGYKKDYYDLSKRVGEDLTDQIKEALSVDKHTVILASGISCREQINGDFSEPVYHPIQFLEKILA
jgi:iron-sulfur cluster protein